MPISKKIFSKKRVKKSVRKNTRKHKKRTPHRKNRKSGKQFRFIGGDEYYKNCPICFLPLTDGDVFTTNCHPIPHKFHRGCIEEWCSGKAECTCPLCRTILNPNPNPVLPPPPPPVLPPPPPVVVDNYGLFRVEFFTYVNNPQTGEIDRVPVNLNDMSDPDIYTLIDEFIDQIPGTDEDNFLFLSDSPDPDGYIQIQSYQPNLVINEGDIDIRRPTTIVQSARITRVPTTTPNPTVIGTPVELPENSYRVEFFRTDGENNRVTVRVQDISRRERSDIIAYLVTEFDGLGFYNIRFNGEHEDNPYGYIVLGDNPYNVRIREGDIFHTFLFNDPEHVPNVTSLRITRM